MPNMDIALFFAYAFAYCASYFACFYILNHMFCIFCILQYAKYAKHGQSWCTIFAYSAHVFAYICKPHWQNQNAKKYANPKTNIIGRAEKCTVHIPSLHFGNIYALPTLLMQNDHHAAFD